MGTQIMLPVYYILIFLSANGYYMQKIGDFPTVKACERAASQISKDKIHYGKHMCLQRRTM